MRAWNVIAQGMLAVILGASACAAGERRLPNFVIIFIDDMGYADIGAVRRAGLPDSAPRPAGTRRAGGSPISTSRRPCARLREPGS